MIEPSVGFQYPDDAAELAAATEGARFAGRMEAMRLLLEMLASAHNAPVRLAALRHLANPQEMTIGERAQALGVSRMTLHRELKTLRAFSILAHVTADKE
jgi:hypothetical protein